MARIEEDLEDYNNRIKEIKKLQEKIIVLNSEKNKLLDDITEMVAKIKEIEKIPLLTRIFRFKTTLKEILEDND